MNEEQEIQEQTENVEEVQTDETETETPIEETPEESLSSEDIQEIIAEYNSTQETTETTYSVDDIVVRLDNLERIQVTFYDNLLDVLLLTLAVLVTCFAAREFMDRVTRW